MMQHADDNGMAWHLMSVLDAVHTLIEYTP